MRRKWGLVFTLAVLGGAALHFLYDVWPNPLTAVLAPVNESVWEHLKLLYWPFLAAAFVLARGADDARGRWCGLLVGLLAAPLLLLGAYYPLRYGFGVHGLWLDLLLYVLAMGAGFLLAYWLQRRALPGWLRWRCFPLRRRICLFSARRGKKICSLLLTSRVFSAIIFRRKQRRSGEHRTSPQALRRGS